MGFLRTTLCLLFMGCGAWAAGSDPVPVGPAPDLASIAIPRSDSGGAWRSRTQQVWSAADSALERRAFSFFDPFAAAGHDIYWEPLDPAADSAGPLDGAGILTWRATGSLRYGRAGIVAQYRGSFVKGLAAGEGTFVHKSGLRYDGGWHAGLMDGTGHLRLPNGDVYRGGFRGGVLHGAGVYLDAAGVQFDGAYRDGLRHGPGRLSRDDGLILAGHWTDGRAPERLIDAQLADNGLAIRVSTGGPPEFCCYYGPAPLGYTSTAFADRLEIFPDAPGVLALWRGEANVVVDDSEGFEQTRTLIGQYSFQNFSEKHMPPVELIFGMENRTRDPVRLMGGFLEIGANRLEAQPAIQMAENRPVDQQKIEYTIENYGWSVARNARLDFEFVHPRTGAKSQSRRISLGDVEDIATFSFADALAAQGLAGRGLTDLARPCEDTENGRRCVRRLGKAGAFRGLGDFVRAKGSNIGATVEGTLRYDWTDAEGQAQTTTAPFETFLQIGSFAPLGECEGGEVRDLTPQEPFALKVGAAPYRIPLRIREDVPAGAINRWRITLDAPQSSSHQMRITLRLSNGDFVRSRDLSLLFFKPRTYPKSLREFAPRC